MECLKNKRFQKDPLLTKEALEFMYHITIHGSYNNISLQKFIQTSTSHDEYVCILLNTLFANPDKITLVNEGNKFVNLIVKFSEHFVTDDRETLRRLMLNCINTCSALRDDSPNKYIALFDCLKHLNTVFWRSELSADLCVNSDKCDAIRYFCCDFLAFHKNKTETLLELCEAMNLYASQNEGSYTMFADNRMLCVNLFAAHNKMFYSNREESKKTLQGILNHGRCYTKAAMEMDLGIQDLDAEEWEYKRK